jgi:hypothetical protein
LAIIRFALEAHSFAVIRVVLVGFLDTNILLLAFAGTKKNDHYEIVPTTDMKSNPPSILLFVNK